MLLPHNTGFSCVISFIIFKSSKPSFLLRSFSTLFKKLVTLLLVGVVLGELMNSLVSKIYNKYFLVNKTNKIYWKINVGNVMICTRDHWRHHHLFSCRKILFFNCISMKTLRGLNLKIINFGEQIIS